MTGIIFSLIGVATQGGGGAEGALYSFTNATFTPGGQTGSTGPSLATAKAGLTGTGVDGWKNDTAYFNTTNGIQLWTIPETGSYTIQAKGAQGGGPGGQGAVIQGTFNLVQGEKIRILVGQQGTGTESGGGGSFVVTEAGSANSDIFVIAGGGGGKAFGAGGAAGPGNSSNNVSNGNGGLGSAGGYPGAAGGGYFTDGGAAIGGPASATGFGKGFLSNGGVGGTGGTGDGGFGGGGSGGQDSAAGAGCGGGYSGGSAGGDGSSGMGAGSYNNGTSQTNTGASNSGAGSVIITKL